MARIVVHVLVLSIFSFLAPASAQQADPHPCLQDPPPVSRERSGNIRVDDVFQPVISGLLAKSETFRRQWDAINSSRFIRVTVVLHLGMQIDGSARARTELSRYAHGSIRARIELPGATDLTELLAHEFEHVIEQLEGSISGCSRSDTRTAWWRSRTASSKRHEPGRRGGRSIGRFTVTPIRRCRRRWAG